MNSAPKILVLEDCDGDYETVLDAARHCGLAHEFCRVTSGDQCLVQLMVSKDKPQDLPALIVLDLNTPKDDGRHALMTIKRNTRLRGIPLVVLSTSSNPRDLAFCYDHGANAYHVKPVNHATHMQVVKDLLAYWLTKASLPTETLTLKTS